MLWVMKKKKSLNYWTKQNLENHLENQNQSKSDVSAACSVSLFLCLFISLSISISINCRHWPNPKELLIFLLLDKFEDIPPVGRDSKREANRFFCVCSAFGKGCTSVLDFAGASSTHGTEPKPAANPPLQHSSSVKADLISDRPQHIHHQEFVSHAWETFLPLHQPSDQNGLERIGQSLAAE